MCEITSEQQCTSARYPDNAEPGHPSPPGGGEKRPSARRGWCAGGVRDGNLHLWRTGGDEEEKWNKEGFREHRRRPARCAVERLTSTSPPVCKWDWKQACASRDARFTVWAHWAAAGWIYLPIQYSNCWYFLWHRWWSNTVAALYYILRFKILFKISLSAWLCTWIQSLLRFFWTFWYLLMRLKARCLR